MIRIISLGAGVQSTTMTLMAAHGELTPMPDYAIFADTGWEPKAVYAHLDWMSRDGFLPFPIIRVSAGNIREDLVARQSDRAGKYIPVPFHFRDNEDRLSIGRRQCTSHYKVEPIRRKIRELLGKPVPARIAPGTVEKWIGISTDEILRITPAKVQFEINRHPLIELRVSRGDCLEWLKRNGYPIPTKSACIGCPYHSNATWREIRDGNPEGWADALTMDEVIRQPIKEGKGEQFMHWSARPLKEVDLSTAEDHGQLNLFNNECEGLCGV